MAIEDSYNFRRVSDTLTTSGVVGSKRLKELSALGYQAVINLLPDSSDFAVADERALVESQCIAYVHIPVDFERPARSDFEQFVAAMENIDQKKLHIHCAANYRVSVFYSLYAQGKGLWDAEAASSYVSSVWEPGDYPGWPDFIAEILG
jgi:uncharacterized protein (TIGR01244 family)